MLSDFMCPILCICRTLLLFFGFNVHVVVVVQKTKESFYFTVCACVYNIFLTRNFVSCTRPQQILPHHVAVFQYTSLFQN